MSNVTTELQTNADNDWVAHVTVPDTCHIDTRAHKHSNVFPYVYKIYLEKVEGPCTQEENTLQIVTPYSASGKNHHVTVHTYLIDGNDINEVDTDEIMVENGAGGGI
jgi:hypothetical protein